MNIFVFYPQKQEFILRPDSTLNKDCSDYWMPDGIKTLMSVPFFYLRIEKNAKSVSSRFAKRYWTFAGYGVYLYAPSMPLQMGHALDFSTMVSAPMKPDELMSASAPACNPDIEELEKAVEKITTLCSLKSGDLVCIPCSEGKELKQGNSFEFLDINFSIR